MKTFIFIGILVLGLSSQAGMFGGKSIGDNVNRPKTDIDALNGDISVGNNSHVDDLNSVNGSIEVGNNSTVGEVETVNGNINFLSTVTAEQVESVNGYLQLGENCKITAGAETVNGSITAGKGCSIKEDLQTTNGNININQAQVGETVENVNGQITITNSRVGGNVETVSGDISIINHSVIDGDLRVHKNSGFFNNNKKQKIPTVIIGKNAKIKGDLQFEQKVKLKIDPTASVGEIIGEYQKL